MRPLTDRQAECLLGIIRYINVKGRSPTVAEVAEMMCVCPNAANGYIKALARKGYLRCSGTGRKAGAVARGLVPTHDDRGYPLKRVPRIPIVA